MKHEEHDIIKEEHLKLGFSDLPTLTNEELEDVANSPYITNKNFKHQAANELLKRGIRHELKTPNEKNPHHEVYHFFYL